MVFAICRKRLLDESSNRMKGTVYSLGISMTLSVLFVFPSLSFAYSFDVPITSSGVADFSLWSSVSPVGTSCFGGGFSIVSYGGSTYDTSVVLNKGIFLPSGPTALDQVKANNTALNFSGNTTDFASAVSSFSYNTGVGIGDGNYWVYVSGRGDTGYTNCGANSIGGNPYSIQDGTLAKFVRSGGVWSSDFYNPNGWKSGLPFYASSTPLDWSRVVLNSASSSGLFSSSQDRLVVITASCSDSSNVFSYGICYSFLYLFEPDPTILNSFVDIPNTLQSRFPFSWISQIRNEVASSSASVGNMAVVKFNLHDLPIASSSPMEKSFLPNLNVFSTSTITYFMPSGTWEIGMSFVAGVLWLGFIFDVYHTARKRFHKA